jgi:UPF0755 protein
MARTKQNKSVGRTLIISFLSAVSVMLFIGCVTAGIVIYRFIFSPNVDFHGRDYRYLYIPTGSDFSNVEQILQKKNYLRHTCSFRLVAKWKDYDEQVRPGRYKLVRGMNNHDLVNLLRSGIQEPVNVVFNNIGTPAELAGKISAQLEADSSTLLKLMGDRHYLEQFGISPEQLFDIIIPDTYQFYWNTSADQFLKRMYRESGKFWKTGRISKAIAAGLTIPEVITLASIVEKETSRNDEKPLIASVYINRLKKNWPLQADPTLIFAWNDYSIRRVLDLHKQIKSPYNTYLHTGLPPGPICLPSVSSIDAVLDYKPTHYMYFCAKDDLSGYHNFAVTLAEHSRNAKKYQAALKKMNIR